jgi:hypothetical protein
VRCFSWLGLGSFAPLFALAACSSSASGALQIITGEVDTLSRPPTPATLQVDSVDSSGKATTLATAALPASNIDLGSLPTASVGTLQVTGADAHGDRVIYGRSLPMAFGALDGIVVPMFVQRTGELARLPNPLPDARRAPTLALLAGRYLFVGGGSDPSLAQTTQLYDFANFKPLEHPPSLPRTPKSTAFVGAVELLIDEHGATKYDWSQKASVDLTPPSGGSFGDVAGGATVFAADGSQYVVGATRTSGAPSATVLLIDRSGALSWKFLAAPRLGASATWVDGRGLVVAGGSAIAAGVEIVGIGSMTGSALAYSADPTTGAGASTLDGQHVLLAGGVAQGQDAGVRVLDLGCAAQCIPALWARLPVPLASAQPFGNSAANLLLVGNERDGTTHVFRLTTTTATEMPTKVAHTQARALISPLGSVVLFGGTGEIESFVY